jgi:hypothetical protein
MSSQPALKRLYLPVLAAAGFGGAISVAGSVFMSRNTVTGELHHELHRRLKPITDTLARHGKLLEKIATKDHVNTKLKELQQTLSKKSHCPPW